MSAKHTPGPWKVGQFSEEVITPNGTSIAQAPESNGPEDDAAWKTNARLIAAAPELLEACKLALRWSLCAHQQPCEDCNKRPDRAGLIAAIAQAEGR